jgi:hypothetical protein
MAQGFINGGSGGGGGLSSINGDTTAAQVISAGSGISVATVSGTTTITNIGGGGGGGGGSTIPGTYVVTVSTATTQSIVAGTTYIANASSPGVYFTYPVTAATGSVFEIVGKGAGGWKAVQNASQVTYFGTATSTTGISGSLEFSHYRDGIVVRNVTANTEWQVTSAVGEITVN